MKRYLFIIIAVLVAVVVMLGKRVATLRDDRNRLSQNQAVLMSECDRYQTKEGLYAASVQALTLRNREFAELRKADAARIEKLNLKIKRLQSMTTSATVTTVEVQTVVRDTVIIRDTVPSIGKAFDWSDTWVQVSGVIEGDKLNCAVQSVDTLRQYVHRVPRKFLFFRWGCKAIRQEVVSSNPHTKIVYAEYIELRK